MTDRETAGRADLSLPLAAIARAAGHELRNALNALVVNLEVVRSRVTDAGTQPFADQAVEQSEESVRLAEASIALLNLIVGAIGEDGHFRGTVASDGIRIEGREEEVERVVRALRSLADRKAVSVDTSGSTVILSIPETTASPTTE